ncbi:MAG: M2 family metallopeptidase [Vicinamibacterales bacterium]|jgi:peptidyl-dipeptidase A|nr:M2 family metallopeptidase [Vicinamibacterales bacterium]
MRQVATGSRIPPFVGLLATMLVSGCAEPGPTVEEARAFVDDAEARLLEVWIDAARAGWVQSNFITDDTTAIAASAQTVVIGATMELATEAARFDGVALPEETRRKLLLLKTSMGLAAPADPALQAELAGITTSMESTYGRGVYCPGDGEDCLDLPQMERMFAESRDTDELLDLWTGWRTISPPLRSPYVRFTELANAGARDLGFTDLGELWRAGYDMPPDQFTVELERLWSQVRPLYESLHCHVRAKLADEYGSAVVPPDEPIPAHLLGNMWSQTWANIYNIVGPARSDPGYDLTRLLESNRVDELEMVRYGERFFSSLGFDPLPTTFWERSLFVQPVDRDVVCHASAWDLDYESDVRIKMCIGVNDEDFVTIHHELGHNYYQRAYQQQSPLHRTSANDGFHEGIGDTIALSITPEYLAEVGLLRRVPPADRDLGLLLRLALDKVAFLPFGLMVDQWRWKVFSGEIGPEEYNEGWWDLRTEYQGIRAPVPRSEADFDPGAKYHIPANTSYTRYFLAHILQFQFHRALCEVAGVEGPLHRCSIFGSLEAGARLNTMLAMGASRPWPDALEVVTGQREMDATAILDYFAPVQAWLDEQNAGRSCGW